MGRANSSQLIELMIAVKQSNTDILEKTLMEVSDPENLQRYGKYLSQTQVNDLVMPKRESIDDIQKWLVDLGVDLNSIQMPSSDFITAVVSVELLEKISKTEYFTFKHESMKDTTVVRSLKAPFIPENVKKSIDFFFPGADLPTKSIIPKIILRETNDDGVTPDFIREIYGISDDHKFGKDSNNRQAVAQFLQQYYSSDDLKQFAQKFNSDSPYDTSSVKVIGPNDATNPGVEASLDIQYITAIGNNISTIFYSTDGQQPGNPENEPFLKWLQVLSKTPDSDIPFVISISYGDDENSVNPDYAKRANIEFQKAGVRGISLLFASGDGGVEGGQSKDRCDKFIPTFPAASPWVTACWRSYWSPGIR
jgi:tripeptidyl-peptidase-1